MDPAMLIEVAAMSRQKTLEDAIDKGDSDIQRFFCDTTMFITGGTGFMGKQMIEKLFRSCKISKIYVLIRSRKGLSIKERLTIMLQDPVFDQVRKKQPNFASKLIPVEGDAAELRLGTSLQDWETLANEVNIIFHMAATIRFDETLRVATMINVQGTREAMVLARACKNLKSFVHVSTAYTQALPNLVDKEVYEVFTPSPIPPETLISMVENFEESKLNAITASLIEHWPNTYTFAKSVAEDVVRTMSDGLPVCIVRPGIVTGAYREPSPGWIDRSCAYGVSGILLGIGLGVVHVFYNEYYIKPALVPCDYVNNVIIASAREASCSSGGDDTKIYTVSSTVRNPVIQGEISVVLEKYKNSLTSPKAIYYNFGFMTSNKMMFTFLTWFMHIIPAYIVDFVCLLLGQERRFVKIYKKAYKMSNAFSYFALYSWLFDDKNTENLFKSLSKTDKTIFNFDIATIDWDEYIKIWCIGIRKYIINDGLKGTNNAIKMQSWLRILHYALSMLYFYCFWKVFCALYYVYSLVF